MIHFWKIVLLGAMVLGSQTKSLTAQPAIDRRATNQPILLVDTEFPTSDVFALRFIQASSGDLHLLAAGEGKVVWQWQVQQTTESRMVSLDPLPKLRWPISRGRGGKISSISSDHNSSVVAFGGLGFPSALVQVQGFEGIGLFTGLQSEDLPFPQNSVFAMEFFSRPSRLLAVGYGAVEAKRAIILIWDIEQSMRPLANLESGFDVVPFLSVSPNGRSLLATDGMSMRVRRWSIRESSPFQAEKPVDLVVPSPVVGFVWRGDHQCLVATRKHGLIPLSEKSTEVVDAAAVRVVIRNRTSRVLSMATRKEGKNVSTWEVASERSRSGTTSAVKQIGVREGNNDWQTTDLDLRVSPAWEFDVDRDAKGRLRVHALAGMRMSAHGNGVVVAVKDGLSLDPLSPDFSKVRSFLDVSRVDDDQPLLPRLQETPNASAVTALAVSPDGKFIAAAGEQRRATSGFGEQPVQEIRLWRVSDGALVAVTPDRQVSPSSLSPIRNVGLGRSQSKSTVPDVIQFSWSGDSEQSLSLSDSLNRQVISSHARKVGQSISEGASPNWKARFERDRFWMTKSSAPGQEVGPFPVLEWFGSEILEAHHFRRLNREYLAIGYGDGILVWDLARLKSLTSESKRQQEQALVRCFYRHTGRLSCLNTSDDGEYLISGATDGSICLWSLRGIEQPHDGIRELGLKLQRDGKSLRVDQVARGLPADFAGLQRNDELLKLRVPRPGQSGSDWIDQVDQMESALRTLPPGLGAVIQVRDRAGVVAVELLHEPLWTMYPMLDGQWVVLTPTQIFGASSDEAMRRFGWHLNLGSQRDQQVAFFPLDLFRETQENIAAIAQTAWKGQRPVVRSLSFDIPTRIEMSEVRPAGRQQASITNELAEPMDLEVTLNVQRSGQEVLKQLELWCNGRLVQQQHLEPSGATSPEVRWKVPKSALRSGDRNLLIAVARSESAKRNDKPDELPVALVNRTVRTINVAGSRRPKMHYLGVGVTDLDHAARFQLQLPIKPLRFAANDVCLLGLALAERAQASGFELGEFRYLVSSVPEGIEIPKSQVAFPTHDEVLKALDRLLESVAPEDFACVSFSCHGFAPDKVAYLVVQNTTPNYRNAVTDRELFDDRLWKLNCPALVLLDACHSGSALTGDSLRGLNGFGLGPEILVSCKPRQESFEDDRLHRWGDKWFGMSLFSASLLEALTARERAGSSSAGPQMSSIEYSPNIDRNGDGFLSVEELGLHATARVPVLQKLVNKETTGAESRQQPDLLPSMAFPRGRIRLRIPTNR